MDRASSRDRTQAAQQGGPSQPRHRTADIEDLSQVPLTAAAWAKLSLVEQIRHSVRSQPQAEVFQMVVGRGALERRALATSLGEILKSTPRRSLRLTVGEGREEEVASDWDAEFLVQAILDRGQRLSWVTQVSEESTAQLARLALGSAKRLAHGANTWRRDPSGRVIAAPPALSYGPPVPVRTAASESADSAAAPVYTCEIVAPAIARPLPVDESVLLPALPASWPEVTDLYRQCADRLVGEQQAGRAMTPIEQEWLAAYAALRRAGEDEAARRAKEAECARSAEAESLGAKEKRAKDNQAQFLREKGQQWNHQKRVDRLQDLKQRAASGAATPRELTAIAELERAVARDARHQARIDRQLSAAVSARAHLVATVRAGLPASELVSGASPIITAKGAYLVYPRGLDLRNRSAKAAWLEGGFQKRTSKITSSAVDFQISCSHASALDREWLTYVIRRCSRAVGRDPDRDVLAATHEPDRHAPSKEDGEPIHVHVHVTFRVCDEDGRTWRCANLHLAIQRELESINRARGWSLTTSAVAKGRQAYWYTPKGSHRIGWSIDGVFTSTDSAEATRSVARERVPADPQRRPGAGIIVVNAQHSARRVALRQADEKRLAEAGTKVVEAMERLKAFGVTLSVDARGFVNLDYYSGEAYAQASSPLDRLMAELCQAVLHRDRTAINLICKRIDYYEE